jgi:hypothetical protein
MKYQGCSHTRTCPCPTPPAPELDQCDQGRPGGPSFHGGRRQRGAQRVRPGPDSNPTSCGRNARTDTRAAKASHVVVPAATPTASPNVLSFHAPRGSANRLSEPWGPKERPPDSPRNASAQITSSGATAVSRRNALVSEGCPIRKCWAQAPNDFRILEPGNRCERNLGGPAADSFKADDEFKTWPGVHRVLLDLTRSENPDPTTPEGAR